MGDTDSSGGGDTSDSDCNSVIYFARNLAENQRTFPFTRFMTGEAFCRVCFLFSVC